MSLSFEKYRDESDGFTLIFDLLRHSLQELGDESFRRFMKSTRGPIEANLAKILALVVVSDDIATFVKRTHKKKMSAKFPITPTLRWAEYKGQAQLGLNACELILRVALFESFMKEIHRAVLMRKPELLSYVKPNRPVKLKDLFKGGFERFKVEEIDRQVREADRLRTKEKAKFFQRRLKLAWASDDRTNRVVELIDLRHGLVHQNPSQPISDKDIQDSRRLFLSIPQDCSTKMAKLYGGK